MQGLPKLTIPKNIKNEHNELLDTDHKKELAYKTRLERIFSITPEDNDNFDRDNEEEITEYLRQNEHLTTPKTIITDPTNNLESVTIGEIKYFLKTTREKTPGISGITKRMLTEAPPRTLEQLKILFNLYIGTGYFPRIYKKAKIIMIPKPGKPHSLIENHRPI